MGRDKAWLEWDGCSLVSLGWRKLRALGVADVFLSGRPGTDYGELGCPVLLDREPGLGPLAGIERGLERCGTSGLLVLAVDLPRVTVDFLARLAEQVNGETGVVPRWEGRWEPLVGIYPKACHGLVQRLLRQRALGAREFAEVCFRVGAIGSWDLSEVDAGCLANWNRPDDLASGRRTG
jgi:molybdopterin-guanine dinucleotide biosynthesis protein A